MLIVYRWMGASVSAELNCEVSAKELQEFWEAEREGLRLSLPALLVSKEARRVTLRFHPQHGPQDRVDPASRPPLRLQYIDRTLALIAR